MQPTAAHRNTLIDHQQYLEGCAREGCPPSRLFEAPGFMLQHVAIDTMHAGDLGI
jgi:hypothetical protein